ncbi:MAG: hypothetical protein AB7G28_07805 [Pirellulales bacterium]
MLALVLPLGAAFLRSKERRPSLAPTLYAVEGKVLVNGAPAENLNVAFHPLDRHQNPFCPVGRTNSKGIFHLTTRTAADGAPAGEYRVTFVWPDGLIDECECPDPTLHDRLQGLYATADQSSLRVEVGPSGNAFWFNAWRPRTDDPLPYEAKFGEAQRRPEKPRNPISSAEPLRGR